MRSRDPPVPQGRHRLHHRGRHFARGRARAGRRPRRGVLGACGARRHPQPHQVLRCARPQRGVVSRRRTRSRTSRTPAASIELYVGDPLGVEEPVQLTPRERGWPPHAAVVPGRQEYRLHRRDPDPVHYRRGEQRNHDGRPRRGRADGHRARSEADLGSQLVAGFALARLLQDRSRPRLQRVSPLARHGRETQCVRRAVQRLRPRFHARRSTPALCLQPPVRPDLLRFRMGDGLQGRGRALRADAAGRRRAAAATALGRGRAG